MPIKLGSYNHVFGASAISQKRRGPGTTSRVHHHLSSTKSSQDASHQLRQQIFGHYMFNFKRNMLVRRNDDGC